VHGLSESTKEGGSASIAADYGFGLSQILARAGETLMRSRRKTLAGIAVYAPLARRAASADALAG
jgi:hypothetical protein